MAQVNVDPGHDSGGSGVNAVAIVAILILVGLAFLAVYFLFMGSDGADVDVNVDASPVTYIYHRLTA